MNARSASHNLDPILGQRLEDRLEIEGGPADHLEELTGRRLLLERDPQLAVARLQLREQADVLDRDDRLIGKGLKQSDLVLREGPRPSANDNNGAHGAALAQHRHREDTAEAAGPRDVPRILRIVQHVLDVDNGPREDRAAGHHAAVRPHGERLLQRLEDLRCAVVMGRESHQLAVEAMRGAVQPAAETHGALHDGIENRLHVGRRLADHAQDLGGRRLLLQRLGQVGVLGLELA